MERTGAPGGRPGGGGRPEGHGSTHLRSAASCAEARRAPSVSGGGRRHGRAQRLGGVRIQHGRRVQLLFRLAFRLASAVLHRAAATGERLIELGRGIVGRGRASPCANALTHPSSGRPLRRSGARGRTAGGGPGMVTLLGWAQRAKCESMGSGAKGGGPGVGRNRHSTRHGSGSSRQRAGRSRGCGGRGRAEAAQARRPMGPCGARLAGAPARRGGPGAWRGAPAASTSSQGVGRRSQGGAGEGDWQGVAHIKVRRWGRGRARQLRGAGRPRSQFIGSWGPVAGLHAWASTRGLAWG
jgi:hypothetical protein